MLLSKPVIRMPEFGRGEWLNSAPLTRENLRGRIVLIDFWDYSCINCVRTLPYVVEWHKRYADKGLCIVGIHTPEFKFAHHRPEVEAAVAEFGLHYPILLDNDYSSWEQFANKAWPTKYLIDEKGYIRYMRRGEGGYQETELAIQQLLQAADPTLSLPEPLPSLREEDESGAVCFRPSPEIYAGYARGALFGGGLGNSEGYLPKETLVYNLPPTDKREANRFYLEGLWKAWPEAVAFAGQEHGRIVLPYSAAGVNAVLSPSVDEVELRLGLYPPHNGRPVPLVEVKVNGRPLHETELGDDVHFNHDGAAVIPVTRPRMYHLIKHLYYDTYELELIFRTQGVGVYTFTFTTCVK